MVPSDRYDDSRTMEILQHIGGCAVTAALTRRPDMSQLIHWLQTNPPRGRGENWAQSTSEQNNGRVGSHGNGICPRKHPSTTLRCHTMRDLFDFTVCEQCYADVIRPGIERGDELACLFGANPIAIPSGFTCQLYSDRMRRVWSEASSTRNFGYLQQKVSKPS